MISSVQDGKSQSLLFGDQFKGCLVTCNLLLKLIGSYNACSWYQCVLTLMFLVQ